LHSAASWVWGAGGDFTRPDGKRTLFCEPPAMEGWLRYFSLYRFMPHPGQPIIGREALGLFANRQAAVTMGSLYLGTQLQARLSAQDLPRLGIALPPGPSLVGGSSLVVWAHTPGVREAADLVVFLTRPDVMTEYCQRTGYLPTRLDVLSSPPFSTDQRFAACIQALQSGRPFPIIQAGGLLENSLANSLAKIWQDIFLSDGQDIRAHLQDNLFPLGRRLDITLSQF
jgi:ABC-type glycerol-3-phosphate transport system substrate-binding protein